MPDISELNGTAIANVAEFDALTVTEAPAFTGLLDTYTGAAAAYSVRRLALATTVLLRVRRDTAGGTGDDHEADVTYDSNNILSLDSAISNASSGVTATTLGQFINVGTVGGTTYTNPDSLAATASCYVKIWYDQAASLDAEQSTDSQQPQIHDGSSNTDLILLGGTPSIQWNSTNQTFLETPTSDTWSDGSVYTSMVFNGRAGPAGSHTYWDIENGVERYSSGTAEMLALFYGSNDVPRTTGAFTGQGLHTWYSVASETNAAIYIDGTLEGSATRTNAVGDTNVTACIGSRVGGSQWNDCRYQEIIHWGSDVASNRTAIEGNINSDYLIYQPTDAPTSGLLATYTGAAAAYSVRQLSDKAVICMRIRRDMGAGNPGDDDEINIGFDANGDLDTQAIADFCTTGTGYVTRWWDQSTNGNHADQATDASQPQIYDGSAVITDNGKPCMSCLAPRHLTLNSGATQPYTQHIVCNPGTTGPLFAYGEPLMLRYDSGGTTKYHDGTFRTPSPSFTSAAGDQNHNMLFYYGATTGYAVQNQSSHQEDASVTFAVLRGATASVGGKTISGNIAALQEFIIWDNDQYSNRTGIETDTNDYFSIY